MTPNVDGLVRQVENTEKGHFIGGKMEFEESKRVMFQDAFIEKTGLLSLLIRVPPLQIITIRKPLGKENLVEMVE